MQVNIDDVEYAGFWVRFLASLLDSIVQLCVLVPLAWWMFGTEFFMNQQFDGGYREHVINYLLPALYAILFWHYKSATPGKIWMGIMLIDAKTGGAPAVGQLVLRYIGYFVCVLTLFIGFVMVAFDKKKRGLHDLMAGTLVIKTPVQPLQEPVHFMDRDV